MLLDASMASAGPHLRDIISEERRMGARELTERLQGLCLLVLATATADGRPLAGPVDGYFLHGTFWFSSGTESVRIRHLAARPAVSATYLPGEELAVTVHGQRRPDRADRLHNPMRARSSAKRCSARTCPKQGPAFAEWLDRGRGCLAALGLEPEKIFTFHLGG